MSLLHGRLVEFPVAVVAVVAVVVGIGVTSSSTAFMPGCCEL
jgi:hypothetical protein